MNLLSRIVSKFSSLFKKDLGNSILSDDVEFAQSNHVVANSSQQMQSAEKEPQRTPPAESNSDRESDFIDVSLSEIPKCNIQKPLHDKKLVEASVQPNGCIVTPQFAAIEKQDSRGVEKACRIGEQGERVSNFSALPIVRYGKQLRNLYIPKIDGGTTEIDTLVISVSGLYILETKNYRGWIYGDESWSDWTVSYSREKKYPLYNPIKQNAAHIRALSALLPDISTDVFFSFIVFSDACQFKRMTYRSPRVFVMKHSDLSEHFKYFLLENDGLLTREAVNTIFLKLKQYTNVSEDVKSQHITDIQSKILDKKFTSN